MAAIALNIAFAVFCLLSLGCGITYSVLVAQLLHFVLNRIKNKVETGLGVHGDDNGFETIMWMIGLAYIIPGAIGLIACLTRRRGVYGAHAFLAIKGVVVLVVLLIMGHAISRGTGGAHFCDDMNGLCVCPTETESELLRYFSCQEINWMVRAGVTISVMFYGGGGVSLFAAILAICIMHKMRKAQLAGQGGTMVSLTNVTRGQFGANPYERFDK